jgi:acyl-CoA thioesterase-1
MRADDLSQKAYDEGLVSIKDEPGLPRVLLIGDSISVDYTVAVCKLLKGRANVHHIPVSGGNTEFGLKHLDEWLGTGKWDVIHFNWGLDDLIIRPDGQHAVPLAQYDKNLRELVRRLKLTGAQLVWATTTPVPEHIKVGPNRKNSDVVAYNAAALAIMRGNHTGPAAYRILQNDLYKYTSVERRLQEIQLPGDVHFNADGCDGLADQVASTIVGAQALAPVKDVPGLPRVLLIGASISVYYTVPTRKLLQGVANVHRIPEGGWGFTTDSGLKHLDELLGPGKWDVVHFNWGMWDLKIKPNGEHEVPLAEYDKNLRELVRRLKLTGAKLVWATNTPVPEHIKVGPNRKNSDVIAYNAAALAIMRENHIPVNDLYSFALPRLKELQIPDDPHFTFAGSDVLAEQVANSILSALRSK